MTMPKIEVGTEIKWSCAAGILIGKVSKVWIGLNAANEMVPWILVTYPWAGRQATTVLCATVMNLKMMKVKVL